MLWLVTQIPALSAQLPSAKITQITPISAH